MLKFNTDKKGKKSLCNYIISIQYNIEYTSQHNKCPKQTFDMKVNENNVSSKYFIENNFVLIILDFVIN